MHIHTDWFKTKQLDAAIKVLPGDDGLRHMLIISSNSYKDHEREIVRQKALERYVATCWAGEKWVGNNVLLMAHDSDEIGDIVDAEMFGPFLVEVARERPDAPITIGGSGKDSLLPNPIKTTIKAAWDMIEAQRGLWGASIGFAYPTHRKVGNEYHDIIKVETSVLWRWTAANGITLATIVKELEHGG